MAAGATTGTWERLGDHTRASGSIPSSVPTEDASKRAKLQEFLLLARERFETARLAEDSRRTQMLIDLKFRCGEQWDSVIKQKRESQGRPCLTINRVPGFLKHVTNAMRQERPEIKVDPVGDGADEQIAEIRQGLIRHILINSHAEVPCDTAFEQMTTMGLGWMRVVDAWDGFDKELFVEWVANPFSVYSDPGARRPDWSDAKWRFVVEDYSLTEFRNKFGKDREACGLENFKSIGDHGPDWMIDGKIRVAEYFHIEEEEDILCELPDGSTQLYSEMDPQLLESVVQSRPEIVSRVVWTLMDGVEILKERKWSGKYIPLIPVIGNQIELDGERVIVGMVRYAREAQRMFNYMYSCFVEAVALAPKAPFIIEFDQIAEFKDIWARANTDPVAYLPYRAKSADNGSPLPMPQRQQAEPPVSAFVEGIKLADENMKAVFSIYDAALGQRGPQESGLAINARKIETDVATYDWIDNFVRALTFLGLVLNDLLPHYYNRKGRIVQITREDLTSKSVTINQTHQGENGEDTIYDLSKGKFGIVISTGPSALTRRREAAKGMLELAKVDPRLMQIAGPTVIKALDFPDKDAIAAQYEKAMPPELRTQDPDKVDSQQLMQKVQESEAKMAQMQQMVQTLSAMLHKATDETEREWMKEQFATYRVELQQSTALAIADLKTGSDESKFMLQKVFDELQRVHAKMGETTEQHVAASDAALNPPASQGSGSPAAAAPKSSPTKGNTPGGVGSAAPTI